VIIELRAKLSSYLLDSPLIDFCWLLGKPSMCPVKQEQHSEPKAVRTILRYNKRLICRGQHRRFGSIDVIGHFSDSVTGCVAKLLKPATIEFDKAGAIASLELRSSPTARGSRSL
jgi:hypothetical protein